MIKDIFKLIGFENEVESEELDEASQMYMLIALKMAHLKSRNFDPLKMKTLMETQDLYLNIMAEWFKNHRK